MLRAPENATAINHFRRSDLMTSAART